MPRVKTTSTNENTEIIKLLKAIAVNTTANKNSNSSASSKQRAAEDAEKKAKREQDALIKKQEQYKKDLKQLEDSIADDKYKSRMGLAKSSVDAVLPGERRAFLGASGIGALMGIDPAFVKALGIDKLGANIWNSKFGFSAIEKRHNQKLKRQRLDEKYGFGTSKDDEKYGSVVKDNPSKKLDEINKGIQVVAKNTGADKSSSEGNTKGESGGLLSKILGFGKKLLIPMLVGMLVNAFRNHIKNGIASLLGGSETAQALGGAVADFLPGAIGGLTAAHKFGIPWWKGALIGGTITYVWPRLMRTFGEIGKMFTAEGNPNAGSIGGYTEKMLAGALMGASYAKWGAGAPKAAAIGAVVGLATETILDEVESFKRIFKGEATDADTGVLGVTKDVMRGAIAGAGIGLGIGGTWKERARNAAIGAAFGAAGGTIWHGLKSLTAGIRDLVTGEGKEQSIGNYFGNMFSDAITGGVLGIKGGPWGIVVGAVLGAAWGFIRTLISDVNASSKKQQESGKAEAAKITNKVNSKDATNSTDFAYNRQKELEAKKAAGTLTDEEKKELGKIESATYKTDKRLDDAKDADANGDGVITKEEYNQWYAKHKNDIGMLSGMGGIAKSDTYMKELLERNGGSFSKKDLAEYQLQKEGVTVPLQSTPIIKPEQLEDEKNTEATAANTEALGEFTSTMRDFIDMLANPQGTANGNQTLQTQATPIKPFPARMTTAGLSRG